MLEFDRLVTVNVIISYVISWIFFLLSLALFQKTLGMLKGAIIAYLSSWLVWVLTVYLLHSIITIKYTCDA